MALMERQARRSLRGKPLYGLYPREPPQPGSDRTPREHQRREKRSASRVPFYRLLHEHILVGTQLGKNLVQGHERGDCAAYA
jgi:hypothetical protein